MKAKLERIIEQLKDMVDRSHDDEFADELDNAVIHLEAASDRLIAMDEEEDEDEEPDYDECPF